VSQRFPDAPRRQAASMGDALDHIVDVDRLRHAFAAPPPQRCRGRRHAVANLKALYTNKTVVSIRPIS
jgi:hypothetical protein